MESISHIVETINNCLWGLPMRDRPVSVHSV